MDYELRCPSCKDYYQSPVYLPCSHSLCYTCALNSLRPELQANSLLNVSFASDLDKFSLTSDNDSGISSSSRPSSLLLPPVLPKISFLSHQKLSSTYLQCPTCSKIIPLDQLGVKNLPKNRLLAEIINRYHGEKSSSSQQQNPTCQLCHPLTARFITRICEQCQIGYCNQCREQYHPMRGPYSKHTFRELIENQEKLFCSDHFTQLADFYCLHCRSECCRQCFRHNNHEMIPLDQAVKFYKVNQARTNRNPKCSYEFDIQSNQ